MVGVIVGSIVGVVVLVAVVLMAKKRRAGPKSRESVAAPVPFTSESFSNPTYAPGTTGGQYADTTPNHYREPSFEDPWNNVAENPGYETASGGDPGYKNSTSVPENGVPLYAPLPGLTSDSGYQPINSTSGYLDVSVNRRAPSLRLERSGTQSNDQQNAFA